MDKIRKEVNEKNSQVFSSISKIYDDINFNLNQSYLTGKKEAYEEILNLLNSTIQANGTTKYLSPSQFQNLIAEKQFKAKIALNNDGDFQSDSKHYELKKKFHKIQNIQFDYSSSNFNPFFNNLNNNNINNNIFFNNNLFNLYSPSSIFTNSLTTHNNIPNPIMNVEQDNNPLQSNNGRMSNNYVGNFSNMNNSNNDYPFFSNSIRKK